MAYSYSSTSSGAARGFVLDAVGDALVYLIARKVFEVHDFVEAVEVTVRKPNPPVGGTCDAAEATYRAVR